MPPRKRLTAPTRPPARMAVSQTPARLDNAAIVRPPTRMSNTSTIVGQDSTAVDSSPNLYGNEQGQTDTTPSNDNIRKGMPDNTVQFGETVTTRAPIQYVTDSPTTPTVNVRIITTRPPRTANRRGRVPTTLVRAPTTFRQMPTAEDDSAQPTAKDDYVITTRPPATAPIVTTLPPDIFGITPAPTAEQTGAGQEETPVPITQTPRPRKAMPTRRPRPSS